MKSSQIHRRRDRGFSLVELLIAVLVLGLTGVALVSAISGANRISNRVDAKAQAQAQITGAAQKLMTTPFKACTSATPNGDPYTPTLQSDLSALGVSIDSVWSLNLNAEWKPCAETASDMPVTMERVVLRHAAANITRAIILTLTGTQAAGTAGFAVVPSSAVLNATQFTESCVGLSTTQAPAGANLIYFAYPMLVSGFAPAVYQSGTHGGVSGPAVCVTPGATATASVTTIEVAAFDQTSSLYSVAATIVIKMLFPLTIIAVSDQLGITSDRLKDTPVGVTFCGGSSALSITPTVTVRLLPANTPVTGMLSVGTPTYSASSPCPSGVGGNVDVTLNPSGSPATVPDTGQSYAVTLSLTQGAAAPAQVSFTLTLFNRLAVSVTPACSSWVGVAGKSAIFSASDLSSASTVADVSLSPIGVTASGGYPPPAAPPSLSVSAYSSSTGCGMAIPTTGALSGVFAVNGSGKLTLATATTPSASRYLVVGSASQTGVSDAPALRLADVNVRGAFALSVPWSSTGNTAGTNVYGIPATRATTSCAKLQNSSSSNPCLVAISETITGSGRLASLPAGITTISATYPSNGSNPPVTNTFNIQDVTSSNLNYRVYAIWLAIPSGSTAAAQCPTNKLITMNLPGTDFLFSDLTSTVKLPSASCT